MLLLYNDESKRNELKGCDYMSNERNCLHFYCELLKNKSFDEGGKALYNIIRTMNMARNAKICGEDFSHLDFGNIPFNGIHFSLNGEKPCDFFGSKLNEWNFRSGHSALITSVRFTADGNKVITGACDKTIIVWDAESGLMINKLDSFSSGIQRLDISQQHDLMLIEEFDNTVTIWDLKEWKSKLIVKTDDYFEFKEWIEFENIIINKISEDGSFCVLGSDDGIIKIIDLNNGNRNNLRGHNKAISAVDISSDGRICVTGSVDGSVTAYDLKEMRVLWTNKIHIESINSIVVSFDGEFCLSSETLRTIVGYWKIETGEYIYLYYNAVVVSMCIPYNESYFISLCTNGDLVIKAKENITQETIIENRRIEKARISKKGRFSLLETLNDIILYDVKKGEKCCLIKNNDLKFGFDFSSDEQLCVVGILNSATIWKCNDGTKWQELKSHIERIKKITVSENNIMVVYQNGHSVILNIVTGKPSFKFIDKKYKYQLVEYLLMANVVLQFVKSVNT